MDTKDLTGIKIPQISPVTGAFPDIWLLQLELLGKYQDIEGLPLWPLNLDTRDNQELMKDFLARVVEELAESYEAYRLGNMDDAKEEMADALHFLMEALIYTTHEDAIPAIYRCPVGVTLFGDMLSTVIHADVVGWLWETTYHLNIARNNLRNKKWKKTQVLAQKAQFTSNMIKALQSLISGFQLWGMGEQDIFDIYYKKNQINHWRIKSKY
jgi:dimeric dUTPase (all-alpha-NTP-PPase superfamily)